MPSKNLMGITFMLIAIFMYSVTNVLIKYVAADYSIFEIVFFRNLFAVIPAFIVVIYNGGLSTLATKKLPYHIVCGAAGAVGLFCLFKSFQLLPLADATCFAYASILFVTALSGPFLKEYIDFNRWCAVFLGFIGIIIIAKPTGDFINNGAAYSLVFAIIDASVMLAARKLSAYDKPATIVFYYALFGTIVSGLFTVPEWQMPSSPHLMQLAIIGLGGGIAQILLTTAYKRAPAGVVAPMIYSSMLWSLLFGYLFWHDVPTVNLWTGAVIVIASSLYIIYRENAVQNLDLKST